MSYNMTDERNAYTRDYPKETIANHVLVGSEACGKQRKVARHPTAQRGAIVSLRANPAIVFVPRHFSFVSHGKGAV